MACEISLCSVLKSPSGSESESESVSEWWYGVGPWFLIVNMCGVSSSSEDRSGGASLSESGAARVAGGDCCVGGGVGDGDLACGVLVFGSVVAFEKLGWSFLLSFLACA